MPALPVRRVYNPELWLLSEVEISSGYKQMRIKRFWRKICVIPMLTLHNNINMQIL